MAFFGPSKFLNPKLTLKRNMSNLGFEVRFSDRVVPKHPGNERVLQDVVGIALPGLLVENKFEFSKMP
jgi:hypothetical protein